MRHQDEARRGAVEVLRKEIGATEESKAVLIDDLFGVLRLVLWNGGAGAHLESRIDSELTASSAPYWKGEILVGDNDVAAERELASRAWNEAVPDERLPDRLRTLERHRNRGWWFDERPEPVWPLEAGSRRVAPVVTFYSFKGGVGRTTALAAFAIQRARAGEEVVVIDADLDAPGVGGLFLEGPEGPMPRWGLADYLLEARHGDVDLMDYLHAVRSERIAGSGAISVMPVGAVEDAYLGKLARLDLEPRRGTASRDPFEALLRQVRETREPDWILIDSRAGLADPAGALLGGFAHLAVLFGTSSEASWAGLKIVLGRLGRERLNRGFPQADCMLVHGMVTSEASERARRAFGERARDEFEDVYYAEEPGDPEIRREEIWYTGDAESSDAPHVPAALHYEHRLAFFDRLESVADFLASSQDHRELAGRIAGRLGRSTP